MRLVVDALGGFVRCAAGFARGCAASCAASPLSPPLHHLAHRYTTEGFTAPLRPKWALVLPACRGPKWCGQCPSGADAGAHPDPGALGPGAAVPPHHSRALQCPADDTGAGNQALGQVSPHWGRLLTCPNDLFPSPMRNNACKTARRVGSPRRPATWSGRREPRPRHGGREAWRGHPRRKWALPGAQYPKDPTAPAHAIRPRGARSRPAQVWSAR